MKKLIGLTALIGILTGCNSGTGVANAGSNGTPMASAPIASTIGSTEINQVYFLHGQNVTSLAATYLDAKVATGQAWTKPLPGAELGTDENNKLTINFQADRSLSKDVAQDLNSKDGAGVLFFNIDSFNSKPKELYFYITANFSINNSQIIDSKTKLPVDFYIGEGHSFWGFNNWWIVTSAKKTTCDNLKVQTEDGNYYYIYGTNDNEFIVSHTPSQTSCQTVS